MGRSYFGLISVPCMSSSPHQNSLAPTFKKNTAIRWSVGNLRASQSPLSDSEVKYEEAPWCDEKHSRHCYSAHNIEADCYSGGVQSAASLLFKKHFLIWRSWENQYAVVAEAFRGSRYNKEWASHPQPKPTDQNQSSGTTCKSRDLQNPRSKSLAMFSREIETCVYFKKWELQKVWK